ncbi:glycine C-acetyltransferase, partial [Candidatus Parcubacteria bacterium]|nr:glycine C-acetyltransferase [Candidatus Parcubacteria bacterium]
MNFRHMFSKMKELLQKELQNIEEAGLSKDERFLEGKQGVSITANGKQVLNFCA